MQSINLQPSVFFFHSLISKLEKKIILRLDHHSNNTSYFHMAMYPWELREQSHPYSAEGKTKN